MIALAKKLRHNVLRIVFILAYSLLLLAAVNSALQSTDRHPLKIGVASMITPVDTVKYYQEIIDYIGEQIGRPVQMVHRRTYDEMDRLLQKGEVKVAFICSAPYVKNRKKFNIELLAAPTVKGKATYHSYVIVHKDSLIKSFPELKGKVFAFTDPKSNTGKLYPTYLLKTMGSSPERYFKRYTYSYSHNKSVELVAKRIVDGAAVESLVYEYMVKRRSPYAQQTKVIKRSPPFGMPPVVVTRDIAVELKKRIKKSLLNMSRTEKGRAILSAMMIDGFVVVPDSAYDSIRQMEFAIAGNPKVVRRPKKREQTIYFGIIPRDNPRIMYEKYQPLLDYLSEKTPYAYELVLKRNYEQTVTALGKGEMDVALLGPLTYLEARAKYGAKCILKPKGVRGTPDYRSVIIKRNDSPFTTLSELKNRSVAFSASKSTSGNLIPRYLLANAGIHLNELSRYGNFDYHDSVVKAVLKGRYDAGAVRDSVAEKYRKHGIEIVATSELIPTGPLVVGFGTPPAVIEQIIKAFLELNPNDTMHRAILSRLDDELKNGFTSASDEDYAGIRKKINAVPRTCGIGCHPKLKL